MTYFVASFVMGLSSDLDRITVLAVMSLPLFPLILWLGGFFGEEEKELIRAMVSNKLFSDR